MVSKNTKFISMFEPGLESQLILILFNVLQRQINGMFLPLKVTFRQDVQHLDLLLTEHVFIFLVEWLNMENILVNYSNCKYVLYCFEIHQIV
jgi:hypothetical protein